MGGASAGDECRKSGVERSKVGWFWGATGFAVLGGRENCVARDMVPCGLITVQIILTGLAFERRQEWRGMPGM
jgi:hypothetical protein